MTTSRLGLLAETATGDVTLPVRHSAVKSYLVDHQQVNAVNVLIHTCEGMSASAAKVWYGIVEFIVPLDTV